MGHLDHKVRKHNNVTNIYSKISIYNLSFIFQKFNINHIVWLTKILKNLRINLSINFFLSQKLKYRI